MSAVGMAPDAVEADSGRFSAAGTAGEEEEKVGFVLTGIPMTREDRGEETGKVGFVLSADPAGAAALSMQALT